MKKILNYSLMCLIIISVISCGGVNENSTDSTEIKVVDIEDFQNSVENFFKGLGFNSTFNFSTNSGEMNINVKFLINRQDSINSFFLDKESNDLIVSIMDFKLYKNFQNWDKINFTLSFENYPQDVFIYNITNEKLVEDHTNYLNNQIFYKLALYSIKELKYMGCTESTQLVKFLDKNVELFEFNGSFYDLLYQYSIECQKPVKDRNKGNLFHFFIYTGSVDSGSSYLKTEHMQYFLSEGGYPKEILTMTAEEIATFLNEKNE